MGVSDMKNGGGGGARTPVPEMRPTGDCIAKPGKMEKKEGGGEGLECRAWDEQVDRESLRRICHLEVQFLKSPPFRGENGHVEVYSKKSHLETNKKRHLEVKVLKSPLQLFRDSAVR